MWKIVLLWCNLWIAKIAVTYAYNVPSQSTQTWELFNTIQCGSTTCSITTQECINDHCECKPDLEPKEDGTCHICPREGQVCTKCCFGEAICYSGRCQRCYMDQNGECIPQTSLFFLTAAQVALATAMVIGVSALATLMYKTFRARSRNNGGQQVLANDLNRTGSSRISLTSIQIRVLRRLRDRPPKYETRHNYEFHQREASQVGSRNEPRTNASPVNQQQTRPDPIIGAPPPAYDGDVASLVDFPPPYSAELPHPNARVAIIDDSRNDGSTGTDETTVQDTGIVNGAFENTEDNDGKGEGSSDINLVNNAKDKTIHI